jgi:hypothetical protein
MRIFLVNTNLNNGPSPEVIGCFIKQYIDKHPIALDAGTEAAEKLVSGFMSMFGGALDVAKQYRKVKIWTNYGNNNAEIIRQQLTDLSVEKTEDVLLSAPHYTDLYIEASSLRQLIEIIKHDSVDNHVEDVIIVGNGFTLELCRRLCIGENPFKINATNCEQGTIRLLDGKKDAGEIYA